MTTTLPYFYDAQLRRIINQVVRAFGVYTVMSLDSNGKAVITRVPATFGGGSRMAQTILNNNSENTVLPVPRIAVSLIGIEMDRSRSNYAGNTEDLLAIERQFDRETGKYTDKRGYGYHVSRMYPNPVELTIQVDIWTSNTDQKFQLFEQIYSVFNPSIDIQTTNNPLDWTAIQVMELVEVNYSNLGVDRGTQDQADVMSLTFKIKTFISPPAKVKKQVLIHAIIQRMGDGREYNDILDWGDGDTWYNVTTPGNHRISVDGSLITLLTPFGNVEDENGNILSWPQLIDQYGELRPNCSKIRLIWTDDIEDTQNNVFGFIKYHPTLDNVLIFEIDSDTLPTLDEPPFQSIINPHELSPGDGLPPAAIGQRYMISDEIGGPTVNWGTLLAQPNDIVEYNGSDWVIAFDSSTVLPGTNVISVKSDTGQYYRFTNGQWAPLLDRVFDAGFFRLLI